MASIHLGRGSKLLGVFTENEVRAGLADGRFTPGDLGWQEGMENWKPLSAFAEFSDRAPDADDDETAEPGELPAAPEWPWEQRRERGIFTAFFATARLVLLRPRTAFAGMPESTNAAIFFLLGGCVLTSFCLIVGGLALLPFAMRAAPPGQTMPALNGATLFFVFTVGWAMLCALLFALALVALCWWAAVVHGCLRLFLRVSQPFATTFRALCFAAVAAFPLLAIPFVGIFAASIAHLLVATLGLAAITERPARRMGLAMLLPAIVFTCGLVAFAEGVAMLMHLNLQP